MRLNLLYVHNTVIGYARYGVKLSEQLEKMDVRVEDYIKADDPANVICWISVPSHARAWMEGQRPVISTMWEATTLPEQFREQLHNFAQVIVPSEHNLELFSQYHDNVTYVPLGVDTKEWAFVPRLPPEDRFVFLIGGSGERKGLDLAYKAFRKLWAHEGSWPKDGPRPTLVFKSPGPVDYFGDRIERVGGYVTDQYERQLYSMAHCYLQPSRGEGWGLQPLQAIAQGCPTVLTDAHGHKAFSDLGWPVSAGHQKAGYFMMGDAGQWWEPSLDDLCEHMEWIFNNYDKACQIAAANSRLCHREFSWEQCARKFIAAVGPEHLAAPYTGTGEWFEPEAKLFAVQVRKALGTEIAGIMYHFRPGETTYEPADVKRILYESGVLDPACVEGSEADTGLTREQVEKAGLYSASHSHCEQCGQVLNSGVKWEPKFDDDPE